MICTAPLATCCASKVIGVGVAVDDRTDRPLAQLAADQLVGRPGGGRGGQGVDHDPAAVAADEGDVGQVEAAHLVDTLGNLEQAVLEIEQGLALQAGIDAVAGLAVEEEVVAAELPGDAAVGVADEHPLRAPDQAAFGALEVGTVGERQFRFDPPLGLDGEGAGRLGRGGFGGAGE